MHSCRAHLHQAQDNKIPDTLKKTRIEARLRQLASSGKPDSFSSQQHELIRNVDRNTAMLQAHILRLIF